MAQWKRLLGLDRDQKNAVTRLYHESRFPLDIRRCLCDWIEAEDWEQASVNEAAAKMSFQILLLKLDELIQESLRSSDNTLTGPNFSMIKDYVMTHFQDSPLNLALTLAECLQAEKSLLDQCAVQQPPSPGTTEESHTDLDNKVSEMENQTQKIEEEIQALDKMESIYKTWENDVQQKSGLAKTNMEEKCFNQANSIRTKKQEVFLLFCNAVNLGAQIIQTLVSELLPEWKRRQQMSCIGKPDVCTSLDHLEKWFSRVAGTLMQILWQLKKLEEQSRPQTSPVSGSSDFTTKITTFTKSLINKLMQNALVVEKQPVMYSQPHRPLVIRTTVNFNVQLRFLVNLSTLEYGFCRAEFDKGVEEIDAIPGFRQFRFKTKNTTSDISKVMKVKADQGLVAEWDMKIEEITAKRKRSNQSPLRVTEELHLLQFSADLKFGDLEYRVETFSLPFVVVSTTIQNSSAWASVLWSSLCHPQCSPLSVFLDPPPLPWQLLSQALSWQFLAAGERGLSEDQLGDLKLKIVDGPEEHVSWSTFSNKDNGPWIWIDGILDLIATRIKMLWRDGCIMGFVNKEKAANLLQNKQSGNFLLRFSESNREGAITFSWVEHTARGSIVHAISPFTKDELLKVSLADAMKTYRNKKTPNNPLLYLYPDIPKDQAFSHYYSSTTTVSSYVKKEFVCEGCPDPPASPLAHKDMDLQLNSPSQLLLSEESLPPNDIYLMEFDKKAFIGGNMDGLFPM